MNSADVPYLALPYQAALAYGFLTLAAHVAAPSAAVRRVSVPVVVLLGFSLPLLGWLLTSATPWASLLLSLPLCGVAALSKLTAIRSAGTLRSVWEEDLARAEAMIAADGTNAAAVLLKAGLLEKLGRKDAALEYYQLTHDLSAQTLSKWDLDEARERLLAAPREPAGTETALLHLPEIICALVGVAYLFWYWPYAVNIWAMTLAVTELRRRPGEQY